MRVRTRTSHWDLSIGARGERKIICIGFYPVGQSLLVMYILRQMCFYCCTIKTIGKPCWFLIRLLTWFRKTRIGMKVFWATVHSYSTHAHGLFTQHMYTPFVHKTCHFSRAQLIWYRVGVEGQLPSNGIIASHAHIHDLPAQMQQERLTETVQLAQPTPSAVYTTFVKKKKNKWWKHRWKLLQSKNTLTSSLQRSDGTTTIVWARFSYR